MKAKSSKKLLSTRSNYSINAKNFASTNGDDKNKVENNYRQGCGRNSSDNYFLEFNSKSDLLLGC